MDSLFKKALVVLIMICCTAGMSYSQPGDIWERTNGPSASRVRAVTFNLGAEIFAAVERQGIYRSSDNGLSWVRIDNGLTVPHGVLNPIINDLATNSQEHLFAGGSENGDIFRSFDNGENWELKNNGIRGQQVLAIAINDSDDIFIGTVNGGVFLSTDNAENWTPKNNGLTTTIILSLAINADGHIFAGTAGENGIFRSTDNGETWVPVNNGLTLESIVTLAINSNGDIFAGVNRTGVFRSTDNGESWVQINNGLIEPNNFNGGDLAINSNDEIFLGNQSPNGFSMFRSTDNGESWTLINEGMLGVRISTLGINTNGDIFAADGEDPNGGVGIFRSTDNGANWDLVNDGLPKAPIHTVAVNQNGELFAGTFYAGAFRSSDNGDTWQPLNNGFESAGVQVIAINSNGHLFAGMNGDYIYRSVDNGESWEQVNNGLTTSGFSAIAVNSEDVLFSAGGRIFRSEDNGDTWNAVYEPCCFDVRALAINGEDEIFAGVRGLGVLRSSDGGDTWTEINEGLTHRNLQSLAINSKGHVFAGTEGGVVFRSLDNGESWTVQVDGLANVSDVNVFAVNAFDHLFAATRVGVFRSSNNAESWTEFSRGLLGGSFGALAINPDGRLFTGSVNGFFRSRESTHERVDTTFTRVTAGDLTNDRSFSLVSNWIDYDNDKDLDLFVANWKSSDPNLLYKNNGDGSFTKITEGEIVTVGRNDHGSSWADYDNDGNIDAFVANFGQNNRLFRNSGEGTFATVTSGEIVNEASSAHGTAWGDYDNDGFVDLFVANRDGEDNFLYRNNGDGTFTKITDGDIVNDGGTSFGCSWADYDNDGDLDLFVANGGWMTSETNFLYQNNGDGTFHKITEGIVVSDRRTSFGGSWGDYDNDGDLDLFVTNNRPTNDLYENNGDGTFSRVFGQVVSDFGDHRGSAWGDFNNDGFLDLFVSKRESPISEHNLLYQNNGDGTFSEMIAGGLVDDRGPSTSSSWGDFDNDGDLDLFVANNDSLNNFLYVNGGNENNWINIKCIGVASNRSAIGAKVWLRATISGLTVWQMQEISGQTGGGYGGQNSLNAEFGIGNATVIDSLRIQWPSGLEQVFEQLPVNQFISITEGDPNVVGIRQAVADVPRQFRLSQNYPNPFNPETTIQYELPKAAHVRLTIYNLLGQSIRTLVQSEEPPGSHSVAWDGRDQAGRQAASGVYIYKITAGDFTAAKKLTVLR